MNFSKDKTVLITGATDGIGKATALELVRKGARVIIHGRNYQKAWAVADWIFDQTGKRVLDIMTADFSSLLDVRRLADEICDKDADIQILINNAGVYLDRRVITADGNELTFQVNYLAPFLLTLLLENLLKENRPSRVINVTSTLHIDAKLRFENLRGEEFYEGHEAYGTSKLALSLFTLELAERWSRTGVEVYHLHPGGVSTKLLRAGFGTGGITPEEGARTSVHLALAPRLPQKSGRYFSRQRVAEPDPRVFDDQLRVRLWNETERLVQLQDARRNITCFKRSAS